MPVSLDPSGEDSWLRSEGLRAIFSALREAGGEARVVGGAVRDALLRTEVDEIDLAASLSPDLVTKALERAGLKVKPTGIAHGTVTAVHDGKGYEITSLRRDVETDGRHARVAFTDDWQADAARRDFTINAIAADESGKLYDYHGGREDLRAGLVRFIGDPRQRIQEDVLRILRFFRFSAWFAVGGLDSEGLGACLQLAPLLPRLSVERVARELLKLLSAPHPLAAWRCMQDNGIAAAVLPESVPDLARLESLLYLEKRVFGQAETLAPTSVPRGLLRLSSALPVDRALCAAAARRLKLSNRDSEILETLAELPQSLERDGLSREAFRRALYRHGVDLATTAALLAGAAQSGLSGNLVAALGEARAWTPITFPIRGKDFKTLGLEAGPAMGKLLRELEDWWIARDFAPSREECLAQAKTLQATL